jgi:hypothetical protein
MAEDTQDIEISNPVLGRLAAKGIRVSDMIGLITLCLVIGLSLFAFYAYDIAKSHSGDAVESSKQISVSIKQSAAAQRLMTCIISLPQERREQEFTQPNSFCQRMSSLQ